MALAKLKNGTEIRLTKAHPPQWYNISIGNSKPHLSLSVDVDNKQVRCELYIRDSKPLFRALRDRRDTIEAELHQGQATLSPTTSTSNILRVGVIILSIYAGS